MFMPSMSNQTVLHVCLMSVALGEREGDVVLSN